MLLSSLHRGPSKWIAMVSEKTELQIERTRRPLIRGLQKGMFFDHVLKELDEKLQLHVGNGANKIHRETQTDGRALVSPLKDEPCEKCTCVFDEANDWPV